MNILIPVDSTDFETSQITKLFEAKSFAVVSVDDGKISSYKFVQNYDEVIDEISAAVFIDQNEYVWPFMERNIICLVAPTQKYIQDIIEAFMFKELYDFSV